MSNYCLDHFRRILAYDIQGNTYEYAYGYAQPPANFQAQLAAGNVFIIRDAIMGEKLLIKQRQKMWRDVALFQDLCLAVSLKYGKRGTALQDELYSDACLPALQRAVVMYDEEKHQSSLRNYARHCMSRACLRLIQIRAAGNESLTLENEPNCDDLKLNGLIARETLYTLGLTEPEIRILLSRYDSGESLQEIADELGYSSRTTAANKLNKTIKKCLANLQNPGPTD